MQQSFQSDIVALLHTWFERILYASLMYQFLGMCKLCNIFRIIESIQLCVDF